MLSFEENPRIPGISTGSEVTYIVLASINLDICSFRQHHGFGEGKYLFGIKARGLVKRLSG